MRTHSNPIKRLALLIAPALAAALLAAPVTSAGHNPPYRDSWYWYALSLLRQTHQSQPPTGHDPWYRYALSLTAEQEKQPSVPFITDTLAPGGGPAQPVDTVQSSGRFSWADAAIGAGVAGGAVFALAAGSLLHVRRRERLAV
jgi:hypothetical protein